MPKKITTLYMYNDLSTAIYPNVVDENIPDTIMRVNDFGPELSKLTEYTFLAPVTIGASGKEQSFYLYGSATVSGALDVEGKATFGSDAEVDGTLTINSASDLVIKDGTTFAEADYDKLQSNIDSFMAIYNREAYQYLFANLTLVPFEEGSYDFNPSISFGNFANATSLRGCFQNTSSEEISSVSLPTMTAVLVDLEHCFYRTKVDKIVLNGGSFTADLAFSLCTASVITCEGDTTTYLTGYSYSTFACCANLTEVGAFDVSGLSVAMNNWFLNCTKLKSVHLVHIKRSLTISSSTEFEESDLVEIIGNLDTVSTAQTLTMGSTNLAKLTQDEILVATGKGWTLA